MSVKRNQKALTDLEKNQLSYFFAQDAVNDYLSFRILFEAGMVLNALQLCSTAVEKLFKSIGNLARSESDYYNTHDLIKLHSRYRSEMKCFGLFPNVIFLEWLSDLYKTRYSSSVYGCDSFDFMERHLLAEVDSLFYHFFSCFDKKKNFSKLYFGNSKVANSSYLNYLSSEEDKSEFIKKSQRIFSILFIGNSPRVTIVSLLACGKVNGFSRGASIVNGENINVNINVGTLGPIDLPPNYYFGI